jgi:hypothetical protein
MISFEVTYEPKARFLDARIFGGQFAFIEQAEEKKATLEGEGFAEVRIAETTAPMGTYPNGGDPNGQDRAYQTIDGIWVWKSNDCVPFADMLQSWGIEGDELARHDVARTEQNDIFFAEYRAAQEARTPEQLAEEQYEMRAAFGPGVTVVNAITGVRTTT